MKRILLAVILLFVLIGVVPTVQGVEYPCDANLYDAVGEVARLDTYPEGGSPRYSAYAVSRYIIEHWGYDDPNRHVVKVTLGNKKLLALGVNGAWLICDKSQGWKQMIYRERPGYYTIKTTTAPQMQAGETGIGACLPDFNLATFDPHYFWEPHIDSNALRELTGEQIPWLGYGPGQEYGIEHGFGGVNIHQAQPVGDVYFWRGWTRLTWEMGDKTAIRLNVAYHSVEERYIIGVWDKVNHIPEHPDGGICMWWVDASAWEGIFFDG